MRKTDLYFIMITLWKLYTDWVICGKKLAMGELMGKIFNRPSREVERMGRRGPPM